MKQIQQTVYVTDDGGTFLDKEKARRHEMNIKNIRHFAIHHTPDLTETGYYTKTIHVAVHCQNYCHRQILYQYLMKQLGWNAIQEGVMGYGYTAAFNVEEITYDDFFIRKHDERLFLSQIAVKGYPMNFNFVEKWKEIIPKP